MGFASTRRFDLKRAAQQPRVGCERTADEFTLLNRSSGGGMGARGCALLSEPDALQEGTEFRILAQRIERRVNFEPIDHRVMLFV